MPKSPAPRQTPRLSTSMKHRPSVSHPSRPDDDFGDFSTDNNEAFEDVDFGDFGPTQSAQTPTKASAKAGNGNGFNMKSMETSLIDFDDLPLPSKPGAGGKQTGFFALTPSSTQTPKAKTNGTASSSGSFLYGGQIGKFQPGVWYATYKDHHVSLVPLCRHLQSSPSPSSTLALLFPPPSTMSLVDQSHTLLKLLLFLSPALQPLRDWGFLRQALLSASDRFDSTCLVAFEMADSKHNLDGMRNAAEASWSVWEAGSGTREQWECGRVWVEKREVFYETSKWDSLENIVYVHLFGNHRKLINAERYKHLRESQRSSSISHPWTHSFLMSWKRSERTPR
jgi:recyclin-1